MRRNLRWVKAREPIQLGPGISPHTLTSRLRRCETYGIVTHTVFAEAPPRVEYTLTPLGQSLRPVLAVMAAWALNVPRSGFSPSAAILKEHGSRNQV